MNADKEIDHDYYLKNRDKIKKMSKEYYESNKVFIASRRRANSNRDIRSKLNKKLISLRNNKAGKALGFDIDLDFLIKLWEDQGERCAITGYPMGYSPFI